MKGIIKFHGKLYRPLEEGAHTIQGEIIPVYAFPVNCGGCEKLREALKGLLVAVTYKGPSEKNGVAIYEARVPMEFVDEAEEVLDGGKK